MEKTTCAPGTELPYSMSV